MAEIILVTSGKGGVGKSSCCVCLGYALAARKKTALIVELDAGLRGLDLMMGVSDKVVYDISDVILGRCEPAQAMVSSDIAPELFLFPAPVSRWTGLETEHLLKLFRGLGGHFDFLLIDAPAGFSQGFEIGMEIADRALVVVTPDPIAARDGFQVSRLLSAKGIENQRLVINRVKARYQRLELLPDLDEVIDQVGVQLIGVIPEDEGVLRAMAKGEMLLPDCKAAQAFENLAARVLGEYRPLAVR